MIQSPNISNTKDDKLFFSNISLNAEEVDILELFGQHGKINDIQLLRDKLDRSRGCGYVEFEDPSSNQKAIEALNGKLYKDSKIHLEISKSNMSLDPLEDSKKGRSLNLKNNLFQNNDKLANKDLFYDNSGINDLPSLPPPLPPPPLPPPMFPMDQIHHPSRTLPLSTAPFMISPDYPGTTSNNESSNDYQLQNANKNSHIRPEYDYDYDYDYSYDYYYSEANEDQPKKSISSIPQVLPPPSKYQLNSLNPNYESDFSSFHLQPLRPPPQLPPLPPIPLPPGPPGSLLSSSSSILVNNYAPSSRTSLLPPPPPTLLGASTLNERNALQQGRSISSQYDIQKESEFKYGGLPPVTVNTSSSLVRPREHHHHHKSSHRIHAAEYDHYTTERMSKGHEKDDQWMTMPQLKESLYWRNKRAQIIEELKIAAYEELKKTTGDKDR